MVYGHKYVRSKHSNNNKYIKPRKNVTKYGDNKINTISSMPIFGNKKSRINNINNNRDGINGLRPEYPVILLCGPPGTGKTTLAHIVAKHCGYRVLEINASMDRNAKKLKNLILSSIEMKSMFTDNRPPLIIMDEIDGSTNGSNNGDDGDIKGSINMLIELIKLKKKSSKKKKSYFNNKNNNNKCEYIMNRPIICCCNNQYSKCLRPLKEIAKVFVFNELSKSNLIKRLQYICRKEYLHCDTKTLSYLCDITHNDVRSCLHTLQFFKEQSGGGNRISNRLTYDLLQRIPIGKKDMTNNLFDLWNTVLKRKRDSNIEWNDIISLCRSLKNDRIMEGIMENYCIIDYNDIEFNVTCNVSELMSDVDLIDKMVHEKQLWSLNKFIPYYYVNINRICISDGFQRLKYPTNWYKLFTKSRHNMDIIREFMFNHNKIDGSNIENNGLKVNIYTHSLILSKYFNYTDCITELIPYLLRIIKPRLPINLEKSIMNTYTKKKLKHLIQLMIKYGLLYKKDYNNQFKLYPNIQLINQYNNIKYNKIIYNEQQMKQINYEINLELMRYNEIELHKLKVNNSIQHSLEPLIENTPFTSKKTSKKTSNKYETPFNNGAFGQRKVFDSITQSCTPTIKSKNFIAQHRKKNKLIKYEYPIQFTFVEGYTNAVRRKTYIRDWI